MTLIVEDGSIVANANSYRSLVEIKAFALARGVSLLDDVKIEIWSAKAIDYLESKRSQYEGSKTNELQYLQFPRINLVIDGFDFPSDEIPSLIGNAQCQLIIEQSLGVVLMPTQKGPTVKSKSIGPIKTEYAVNPGSIFEPYISSVDNLLAPLLKSNSNGFGLSFLRV